VGVMFLQFFQHFSFATISLTLINALSLVSMATILFFCFFSKVLYGCFFIFSLFSHHIFVPQIDDTASQSAC
jgi:hypothetical protein